MRNNFLAQSLAKNNSATEEKKPLEPATAAAPSSGPGGPKALRSMAHAIENLTSHAPQELDPHQIADSEIEDRIDTRDGLDSLIDSIRTSGQKLPILVRHRKASSGPIYEVVYGRRRLAASRALGIKVKAIVREMDKTEALMSQALENSARMDRSFIEQALFALRLSQAGLSAEQIIEGLAINPTLLKRLLAVSKALPSELILAIGAAHEAGRRPWLELKDLIKANPQIPEADILAMIDPALPSYERLMALIAQIKTREAQDRAEMLDQVLTEEVLQPVAQPAHPVNHLESIGAKSGSETAVSAGDSAQRMVGSLTFTAGHKRAILTAAQKEDRGFLEFLGDRLEDLYAEWARDKHKT